MKAEDSTWRNRSNMRKQIHQRSAANMDQSLDWTVAEGTNTKTAGRLQYAKELTARMMRMGHTLPITRQYMSGPRASEALIPNEQAYPIAPEQIRAARDTAQQQQQQTQLRAGIIRDWKSVARRSDVTRPQRDSVKAMTPTALTIWWSSATKATVTES